MKRLAPAVVAFLVLAAYASVVELPAFGEWYEEQSIARVSRFDAGFFGGWAGYYYRPAARWADQVWFHVCSWLSGARCPLPLDRLLLACAHAGAAAVLSALLLRRTRSPVAAALGGLVYGLHPLHVASIAYLATRWGVLVPLIFLLCWYGYERAFDRLREDVPRAFFVAMAPVLLFLALLSELGAVGMGIIGAWLVVACGRRGEPRFTRWCLAPLAPVPLVYLALRWMALGHPFAPYGARVPTLAARLLAYARNLVHDVGIFLSPLRLSFLGIAPEDSPARVVILTGACLAPVVLAVCHPRTRRFLAGRSLAILGLALFVALQVNGLWLLARPPIARAGFDRGTVYSLPLACLAALAGEAVAALSVPAARHGLAGLLACFVAAETYATERTLDLWQESGRIMRSYEERLTPFLRALPAGTALSLRRFPKALKAPFLGWAYVDLQADVAILSAWGGKPFTVYWETGDAPPPLGFRGWVIEGHGAEVRWWREDALDAVEAYLSRRGRAAPQAPRALEDRTIFPQQALVEPLVGGGLRVRLLGERGQLGLEDTLETSDYGVLRYEFRTLNADTSPVRPRSHVYFRPAGGEYDEFLSARAVLILDPEWREVRLPLFESPAWLSSRRVDALRLQPLDRSGLVEIRGLRLENDLEWAEWEWARLSALPR